MHVYPPYSFEKGFLNREFPPEIMSFPGICLCNYYKIIIIHLVVEMQAILNNLTRSKTIARWRSGHL